MACQHGATGAVATEAARATTLGGAPSREASREWATSQPPLVREVREAVAHDALALTRGGSLLGMAMHAHTYPTATQS